MTQETYNSCLASLKEAYLQTSDAYDKAMANEADDTSTDDLYVSKLEAELIYRKAQKKTLLQHSSEASSIKNDLDNTTKELKKSLHDLQKINETIELASKVVAFAAKLALLLL